MLKRLGTIEVNDNLCSKESYKCELMRAGYIGMRKTMGGKEERVGEKKYT